MPGHPSTSSCSSSNRGGQALLHAPRTRKGVKFKGAEQGRAVGLASTAPCRTQATPTPSKFSTGSSSALPWDGAPRGRGVPPFLPLCSPHSSCPQTLEGVRWLGTGADPWRKATALWKSSTLFSTWIPTLLLITDQCLSNWVPRIAILPPPEYFSLFSEEEIPEANHSPAAIATAVISLLLRSG